jgi:hypothetical protein
MSRSAPYRPWLVALAASVVGAMVAEPLAADIFILESGGRIEGEWLNRQEQPLTKYSVRQAGVLLDLPAASVREAIRQSPAEMEYARLAPAAADTVEGQWELAEWCRNNSLARHREIHLRRIIELNPDHQQARLALGYQFLQGQWTTRSDARRKEGYEFYKGRWRTAQEIQILEGRAKHDQAETDWLLRLKKLRRELDDPEKSRLAYKSLTEINDPAAVRPLGEYFARERVRSVKQLYAEILARMKSVDAVRILVDRALSDPDEEIFYACISKIVQTQTPHVADAFIAALKDNENIKVNRAAAALARLQDKSAVSPLIDALRTTHTRLLDPGRGADATTTAFTSAGTMMKKGEGPEVQISHVQNQPVLDALTKLTGVDFGFDQRAWRYWHAQEKIAKEAAQQSSDIRRN